MKEYKCFTVHLACEAEEQMNSLTKEGYVFEAISSTQFNVHTLITVVMSRERHQKEELE